MIVHSLQLNYPKENDTRAHTHIRFRPTSIRTKIFIYTKIVIYKIF